MRAYAGFPSPPLPSWLHSERLYQPSTRLKHRLRAILGACARRLHHDRSTARLQDFCAVPSSLTVPCPNARTEPFIASEGADNLHYSSLIDQLIFMEDSL